jgi:hypothetical protein
MIINNSWTHLHACCKLSCQGFEEGRNPRFPKPRAAYAHAVVMLRVNGAAHPIKPPSIGESRRMAQVAQSCRLGDTHLAPVLWLGLLAEAVANDILAAEFNACCSGRQEAGGKRAGWKRRAPIDRLET